MSIKNSDKKLIVRMDRCPSNHPCPAIRVCSVNALSQRGYNAPTVDMDACVRCGRCVKYCPMQALVME